MNLWENGLKNDYIFLNTIEGLFKYLTDNNLDFNYLVCEYDKEEKMQLTDKDHPIAIPKSHYIHFYEFIYINPFLYNKHKEQILLYKISNTLKGLTLNNNNLIDIKEEELSDDLFKKILLSNTSKTIKFIFQKSSLTKDQIKALKNAHIEAIQIISGISTKVSERLKINKSNISGKKDTCTITISKDIDIDPIIKYILKYNNIKLIFIQDDNEQIDELYFLEKVSLIIDQISQENKQYDVSLSVNNRYLFNKSNLIKKCNNNIKLFIYNDNYEYSKEEYLEEEYKLDKLIAPIKNANLSPLEKYIAIYDIVKKYNTYKECPNDIKKARNLRYILNSDYIVCIGFSKLLCVLLEKVNIKSTELSLCVDTSYEDGFSKKDIPLKFIGHRRVIVKIDDNKYNIHGLYLSDPTWDNSINEEKYFHTLITFNKNKESCDLQNLSNYDLLLDFNSPEEFNDKIEYYIRNKINICQYSSISIKIMYSYYLLYSDIMEYLFVLDYQKYIEYYNKYGEIFSSNYSTKTEYEKAINELLNDYQKYILNITNKEVGMKTIFLAATTVKRKVYKMSNIRIKKWYIKTIKTYKSYNKLYFPYTYNPKDYKNNYLKKGRTK